MRYSVLDAIGVTVLVVLAYIAGVQTGTISATIRYMTKELP